MLVLSLRGYHPDGIVFDVWESVLSPANVRRFVAPGGPMSGASDGPSSSSKPHKPIARDPSTQLSIANECKRRKIYAM